VLPGSGVEGRGFRGRECMEDVGVYMYTHISKCKSDKVKGEKIILCFLREKEKKNSF
jgi:hypothetical protein